MTKPTKAELERAKCNCDVCKHSHKFMSIIKNLSKEDKTWMENFYSYFMCIAEDNEYKGMILKGDWPSAIEQLEYALQLARRKK